MAPPERSGMVRDGAGVEPRLEGGAGHGQHVVGQPHNVQVHHGVQLALVAAAAVVRAAGGRSAAQGASTQVDRERGGVGGSC